MSLTPADHEWIRRLPADPLEIPERDVAALRTLQRRATDPSELRLLGSILRPLEERQTAERERAAKRNRLEVLRRSVSPEVAEQSRQSRETAVAVAARKMMQHDRLLRPEEAQQRARVELSGRWAERDRLEADELARLEAELSP